MKEYRPYSLYAYGQVDGRITFQYRPRHKCDQLLVNVRQMDILWNETDPDVECFLILLSFDPACRLAFDARYFIPDYEDLLEEGKPIVFHICQGIVEVDQLDPEIFYARY